MLVARANSMLSPMCKTTVRFFIGDRCWLCRRWPVDQNPASDRPVFRRMPPPRRRAALKLPLNGRVTCADRPCCGRMPAAQLETKVGCEPNNDRAWTVLVAHDDERRSFIDRPSCEPSKSAWSCAARHLLLPQPLSALLREQVAIPSACDAPTSAPTFRRISPVRRDSCS